MSKAVERSVGPTNSSGGSTGLSVKPKGGKLELPPISVSPAGAQTRWLFYKPTQYMHIKEFNIHVFGTESVSEWMMRESYVLIYHMVAALKRPEDRAKFSGHQAFLITDADPDLTRVGSVKGHRNTGGKGFSLFNEVLVCAKAVDTIRPHHAPEYRGWDTPVHEFGHSIEHTLGLEARSNTVFEKHEKHYNARVAREYFAWATQQWFDSSGKGRGGRAAMPEWKHKYLSEVFDEQYKWVPVQDPRP